MFTVKSLRNLLSRGFQAQYRGVAGIASSFPAPIVRHEPLPASPAFFTARPEYHSLLVQLELFHERFRNLPKSSGETLLFRGMISRTVLSNHLGLNVPLTVSEHRKVSQRVLALARLPAYTAEAELRDFLAAFEKPLKVRKVISQAEAVDEWGRAYAYGWRKSASCRAWIVPAKETGQVLVNGKPLSEYFVKMEDAEQVVYPLSLTDMVGRYNVWCLVRGGGTTGRLTWGVLTEEC